MNFNTNKTQDLIVEIQVLKELFFEAILDPRSTDLYKALMAFLIVCLLVCLITAMTLENRRTRRKEEEKLRLQVEYENAPSRQESSEEHGGIPLLITQIVCANDEYKTVYLNKNTKEVVGWMPCTKIQETPDDIESSVFAEESIIKHSKFTITAKAHGKHLLEFLSEEGQVMGYGCRTYVAGPDVHCIITAKHVALLSTRVRAIQGDKEMELPNFQSVKGIDFATYQISNDKMALYGFKLKKTEPIDDVAPHKIISSIRKQIYVSHGVVERREGDAFAYNHYISSDTGLSGTPILNKKSLVVGIHTHGTGPNGKVNKGVAVEPLLKLIYGGAVDYEEESQRDNQERMYEESYDNEWRETHFEEKADREAEYDERYNDVQQSYKTKSIRRYEVGFYKEENRVVDLYLDHGKYSWADVSDDDSEGEIQLAYREEQDFPRESNPEDTNYSYENAKVVNVTTPQQEARVTFIRKKIFRPENALADNIVADKADTEPKEDEKPTQEKEDFRLLPGQEVKQPMSISKKIQKSIPLIKKEQSLLKTNSTQDKSGQSTLSQLVVLTRSGKRSARRRSKNSQNLKTGDFRALQTIPESKLVLPTPSVSSNTPDLSKGLPKPLTQCQSGVVRLTTIRQKKKSIK